MDVISKRFRHGKLINGVMVDGKLWFVTKEIVEFFGISRDNTGRMNNNVSAVDQMVLNGRGYVEKIAGIKPSAYKIGLVNKSAILTFMQNCLESNQQVKANGLMLFINMKVEPEMEHLMKMKRKTDRWKNMKGVIEPKQPEPKQPEPNQPDLFHLSTESRVQTMEKRFDELQRKMKDLQAQYIDVSNEIGEMKEQKIQSVERNEQGDQMVKVQDIIDHLRGSGTMHGK